MNKPENDKYCLVSLKHSFRVETENKTKSSKTKISDSVNSVKTIKYYDVLGVNLNWMDSCHWT